MRASVLVAALFASVQLVACGYADPISQDRFGGRLVLVGDRELAIEEAKQVMATHCGIDNYAIDAIEEVVVDEEEYMRTTSDYDEDVIEDEYGEEAGGSSYTETRAGVEEVVELHLFYSCVVPRSPPLM